MGVAAKQKEVILALKEVRKAEGYSIQRIHDMVEEAGGGLSITTIKRVFAEGSEDQSFRYIDTIKPIADVLLKLEDTRRPEEESVTGAALREVIELKNVFIAEKDQEIERLSAESQRKIDFLREQIKTKDRLISVLVGGIILMGIGLVIALGTGPVF